MAKIQIKPEKLPKHCNRQRKALQSPTQSIATANAKHCNRQRKALHLPMQSIASANAKHCQLPTQMFVGKGAFI
ncbi:MAG: hypothetical protein MR661_05465 [Prevotella sp.]|nr:hypothetical protein [Prevotella sp.]